MAYNPQYVTSETTLKERLKSAIRSLPWPLQIPFVWIHEQWHWVRSVFAMRREYLPYIPRYRPATDNKPTILFYSLHGMSFGGTEKMLQILAKHISKEKYRVLFMYAPYDAHGTTMHGRFSYVQSSNVLPVEYSYLSRDDTFPFYIHHMYPHIKEIMADHHVDLLITAGAGYSEYPLNVIHKTPIININIFGAVSLQHNIKKHICISEEVASKIRPLVSPKKVEVMYIPSEGPTAEQKDKGLALRAQLNIPYNAMTFGRIGRADNGIFDPIGIKAFARIVELHPHVHYIIMSPPPVLVDVVARKQIPNVHFLSASASEDDIWAFHNAIDVLAHFRADGESCGLNIIESMLCGKPVISHRSPIWNAHTEYLDPSFSIVTDTNDVEAYTKAMQHMIDMKHSGGLTAMSEAARVAAQRFLIGNNVGQFESWIDQTLQYKRSQ